MTSNKHIHGVLNLAPSASIKPIRITLHHLRHELDMVLGSLKCCLLFVIKLSDAPVIVIENTLGLLERLKQHAALSTTGTS